MRQLLKDAGNSLFYWILLSMIPGVVPFFFRWVASKLFIGKFSIVSLDSLDMITFSIALSIQGLYEIAMLINNVNTKIRWLLGVATVFLLICSSFLYPFHFPDKQDSKDNFNHEFLQSSTFIVFFASIVVSFLLQVIVKNIRSKQP